MIQEALYHDRGQRGIVVEDPGPVFIRLVGRFVFDAENEVGGLTDCALWAGLARSDCQQKCQQGVYWRSTGGVLNGLCLSNSEGRCHFSTHEASALTDSDPRLQF